MKYWADQSAPWVQILLKYVEEELKALASDAALFTQIYTVQFETLDKKRIATGQLNDLRDLSLQRLDALAALAGAAGELRNKRASLNAVTDSFYENGELAVPGNLSSRLVAQYRDLSRKYVADLQRFAREVCKRRAVFPQE